MSGSSRHGGHGGPRAAGSGKPGSGKPGSGKPGTGRQGTGRPAAGRALPSVDAEKVAIVVEPVISAMGMDLDGVRVSAAGRRRLLRLIVDADGGVSLDDIARASRELSAVLDDSPVMGDVPYTLEVSSPGVDRPLTERRHWRRAIGRLVVAPLAGAGPDATVTGRVAGASADGITLDISGESRQFSYGDLGPGRIQVEFAQIAGDDEPDIDDADLADLEGADEEGHDGY
jgi:ribosome maturation factor RimP